MTDTIVVGGGLAGITTALRLTDAGQRVLLIESRSRLGGLTHSFRRNGLDVDNGQHVFMRCCTSYRMLLDRLGATASTELQRRLDVPVVRVDGRHARLRRQPLPAPLHLSRSLASYAVVSLPDRARAIRGALALRSVDRDAPATDAMSFGDWLARHGQTDATVAALWDLVGVATMNLRASDVSLATAAMVFQVGLLTDAGAADLGWSRVPLQQLHGDAALAALGAAVQPRTRVTSIDRDGSRWLVHANDETFDADAVVVATDHVTAERLLPAPALDLQTGWSRALGFAPIVNAHVVLDRVVTAEPFFAGIGGDVQWVFDRTEQSGLGSGQYLAISLSAADGIVDEPVAALRERLLPELARLLPAMRSASVLDFFVTREPRATFRAAPGSARLRPGAQTLLPGLFLAGAYTATGWPATMESAARSGELAAAAVLSTRSSRRAVVAA